MQSPTRTTPFAIVPPESAHPEALTLRDGAGHDHHLTITTSGALRVRIDEGNWHGTITLERE